MTSLLKDVNLPPLAEHRRQNRLILFIKNVFGWAHVSMDKLRPWTRLMHNLNFCHLYTRINCYKFSFLPTAPNGQSLG